MAIIQDKIKGSARLSFLQGGGKMGKRMRSLDWSKTPLGNPDQWHLSLQSMVGVILNSPSGKYIAWGEDYTQIYNDSYLNIIESHDSNALGKSAKETFTKSWTLVEPVFKKVMQGEIVEYRDFEFPLERNGQSELCYFDVSYLPIYIENGIVGGVLVTIIETTERKKTQAQLIKSSEELSFAIEAAELGTFDFDPVNNHLSANDRFRSWFGIPVDTEIEPHHIVDAIVEDDKERVVAAVRKALTFSSDNKREIIYSIKNSLTQERRILKAKGEVVFNAKKEAIRFSGILQDITESESLVRKLANRERHIRSIINQAPVAIAIFKGEHFVCEIANERALEIWGKTEKEMIGFPLAQSVPEHIEQGLIDEMQKVYETQVPYQTTERSIYFFRNGEKTHSYFTFTFEPVYNSNDEVYGVMSIGIDVSDQVKIRREIEESNKLVRDIIESSPFPIAVYTGPEFIIELVNQPIYDLWEKGPEIIGKSIKEVLPELGSQGVFQQLEKVYHEGSFFEARNQRINFKINDQIKSYYFNYQYTPLFDTTGKIYGVLNTAADVTDLNLAKQKIEENEKRFKDLVKQAPFGIALIGGSDYVYEMVNAAYLKIISKTQGEVLNRKVFDVLPGIKKTSEPIYQKVYTTGTTQYLRGTPFKITRDGIEETIFHDIIYHPLKEPCGTVTGFMVIASEVTETVNAQKALKRSENYFRDLINNSPLAMAVLRGEDLVIETANSKMLNGFWNKKSDEVLRKKFIDVFPEMNHQRYLSLFHKVLNTGENYNETGSKIFLRKNGKLQRYYIDFELTPLFDSHKNVVGVVASLNDVTAQVESRHKLEAAEARLRIATETTGIGTWEFHIKEEELIYSPRLNEIFGQPKDAKLSRKDMRKQISKRDFEKHIDGAMERALDTGNYNYQVKITKPDNSIAWIKVKGKLFFEDDNKTPDYIIGTIQDVTQEILHQKALESSEQKFRTLADSIPQIVWTTDSEGRINYWNKAGVEYSGINASGEAWGGLIHPDDKEENLEIWKKSIATGNEYEFEHRIKREDNEYRWHLSRALPQKDKEGKIIRWVGASTDIQEIKELEEQKDFFIGMASHELKTPITSIKGYVQILQEMYAENGDEFLISSLGIVDKQIRTLTGLITDLLDLSKIKSGTLVLNKTNFRIREFVEEYIDEIEKINPKCRIIFEPSENIEIFADKNRLGQVLINFLTNAVKYSPENCDIHIKEHHSESEVTVSVQDFGIGINLHDQKKIFERFYRVEGTSEKTYPGFGIGLNIAAEIIERHNGTVNVESELGKGSTFSFTIPRYNQNQ